jgi:hypothetical protein
VEVFPGHTTVMIEPVFRIRPEALNTIEMIPACRPLKCSRWQAGRDIFDAGFIMDRGYPRKESLIRGVLPAIKTFPSQWRAL